MSIRSDETVSSRALAGATLAVAAQSDLDLSHEAVKAVTEDTEGVAPKGSVSESFSAVREAYPALPFESPEELIETVRAVQCAADAPPVEDLTRLISTRRSSSANTDGTEATGESNRMTTSVTQGHSENTGGLGVILPAMEPLVEAVTTKQFGAESNLSQWNMARQEATRLIEAVERASGDDVRNVVRNSALGGETPATLVEMAAGIGGSNTEHPSLFPRGPVEIANGLIAAGHPDRQEFIDRLARGLKSRALAHETRAGSSGTPIDEPAELREYIEESEPAVVWDDEDGEPADGDVAWDVAEKLVACFIDHEVPYPEVQAAFEEVALPSRSEALLWVMNAPPEDRVSEVAAEVDSFTAGDSESESRSRAPRPMGY